MAARLLLKRVSGCFSQNTSSSISNPRGIAGLLRPFQAALYGRENHTRTVSPSEEVEQKSDLCNDDETPSASKSMEMIHPVGKDAHDVKYRALSSLKPSNRHDLAMIFTCKVCETRSVKTTCRESYEKGIVVVRCSGCNNLHLMADHLGWFGEPGSVEELLAARGEEVKKGSVDTLCLTLEDLAGTRSS